MIWQLTFVLQDEFKALLEAVNANDEGTIQELVKKGLTMEIDLGVCETHKRLRTYNIAQ